MIPKIQKALQSIRKEAAIEAAKLTFGILGVGSTLGEFSVMKLWLMIPASLLILCTWGVIYRMCE